MRIVRMHSAALLAAIVGGAWGCGSGAESDPSFDLRGQELASANGMSSNGLSSNGLSSNGMSSNGLSSNGLSSNGLSSNGLSSNGLSSLSFANWWASQTESYAAMVMRYVVKCAYSPSQTLSYTAPSGTAYAWQGNLGIAPTWASGQPIPAIEKQLMTACLAAHANKFGIVLGISVLGLDAAGTPLPQAANELSTYSVAEGAFFGNLYDAAGIYACSDTLLPDNKSSARACAFNNQQSSGTASPCPEITFVGSCSTYCKKSPTNSPYWTSCTYKNVAYRPLTTHIPSSDVFVCGDGVCQVSESPGKGLTFNSCKDCL